MNNIEIFEQRIDDTHLDSYWYDGLIAKGKTYELRVVGDVEFNCQEPEEDKDVIKMHNDNEFELHNWFEINEIDSDFCGGDMIGNYDDAIKALIKLEKEQTNE